MSVTEMNKLVAELRFMDVFLPDIYDRVTIVDNHIIGIDLDSVDLSKFPHFPVTIVNLPNLRHLSLRFNRLKTLPTEVTNISTLKRLDLGHNQLSSLPDTMDQLKHLIELRLDHNFFSSLDQLPPNIYRLQLSHNTFSTIPPQLTNYELNYLSLANNKVTIVNSLPSSIYYLNLRSNPISTIDELPVSLQKLNLYNTTLDWSTIDQNILPRRVFVDYLADISHPSVLTLRSQIRDLRFSRDDPPQFGVSYQGVPFASVMVYGQDFVGKQSLVETYIKHHLVLDENLFISQNRYLNWDHYLYRYRNMYYQIWYPYSQELSDPTYRTSVLNGFYYTSAVILVFDITKQETFRHVLRSLQRIYEIRQHNCKIIVVGTKVDLRGPHDLSYHTIRKTLIEVATSLGISLPYLEVSVTEAIRVREVFETLYQMM